MKVLIYSEDVNIRLVNYFLLKQENGEVDPFVRAAFNNLCPLLPTFDGIQKSCLNISRNGKMGLFEVNANFYGISTRYIGQYLANPTRDNVRMVGTFYTLAISTDLTILKYAYPRLVNHILNELKKRSEEAMNHELMAFIGVLISTRVYTLSTIKLTLSKVKQRDLARRKILVIIPYSIISKNKILCFYLLTILQRSQQYKK